MPDYLNLAQTLAWEEAVGSLRDKEAEAMTQREFAKSFLPGVLEIVQEWHLEGLPERMTAATFPFSPHRDAYKLIQWLIKEIGSLYSGEQVPND